MCAVVCECEEADSLINMPAQSQRVPCVAARLLVDAIQHIAQNGKWQHTDKHTITHAASSIACVPAALFASTLSNMLWEHMSRACSHCIRCIVSHHARCRDTRSDILTRMPAPPMCSVLSREIAEGVVNGEDTFELRISRDQVCDAPHAYAPTTMRTCARAQVLSKARGLSTR